MTIVDAGNDRHEALTVGIWQRIKERTLDDGEAGSGGSDRQRKNPDTRQRIQRLDAKLATENREHPAAICNGKAS